ncbi:MAG: heme o synthase, partial [Actinomycetota bacterium]|nr:heme o synthase [Actinomycetota bacterium]
LRAMALGYLRLTKPRIVLLLLITTVPSMMLAATGVPPVWLMAATLVGGTALAGGANAINQYLERDIDRLMARTRHRPLPTRMIEPKRALAFGLALGAVGFAWLTVTVNVLAAVLALSAFAFYVLVYTAWLKPTSPQNIVIGGAAGAVPVLVGWAAVTGTVAVPAVVLFAVIFLWTPPHFWALAMRYERDYSAAGIPMLPVVAGKEETTKRILRYSVLLVGTTLALYPVARMGVIYGVAALLLGIVFLTRALQLRATPSVPAAIRLFRFSIVYLALLFGAVALDVLVPVRWPGA